MRKYSVQLTEQEREQLTDIIRKGKAPARQIARAHILLKAHNGERHADIAHALGVSEVTVTTVCREFQTLRTDAISRKRPNRVYARRLDGAAEAQLIALACSAPPEGRVCWTMQLLADRMVQLEVVETISAETVRRTLKKTNLSLGRSVSTASLQRRTPRL